MSSGPFIVSHHRVFPHERPTGDVLYREAFATLGKIPVAIDVHLLALREVDDRAFERAVKWAETLPEVGGTLSLPDGSVIEVEATKYVALARQARLTALSPVGDNTATILATWNAELGIGLKEAV